LHRAVVVGVFGLLGAALGAWAGHGRGMELGPRQATDDTLAFGLLGLVMGVVLGLALP
jgi:hypothetical protein